MSKFKTPKILSYSEFTKTEEDLEAAILPILNKIAIEHNNILTYIKDKESIVFDGNVHKYNYFLYSLELDSLKKAQGYLSELGIQYYRLKNLEFSSLLLPGDYGRWNDGDQMVKSWERAQVGIITDMLDRGHIDRIVNAIIKDHSYRGVYAALHDGMLAAGYNFYDKTVRKMASEMISNIEFQLSDKDVVGPDITDPIHKKHYNPSLFRKTPKPL